MPRRRQPESLKRLCMKMVAKYFEAICYPVVHPRNIESCDFKKWVASDIFMNTKPKFNRLDAAVSEELLRVVSEMRNLQKHHVHMLITRNTNRIKLHFGVIEDSYALRFLRDRAKCLQHLDLSSLHHLSPQLLIESIQCFPELITLNLSKTSAVNQVCATVGKYCPNIVDLDISYSEITDKGVLDLVHLQCGRQAQRMHRLNVLGLKLNHGTVTFILQNLPNLQVLEEENLFAAFRGLRGKKLSVAARKSTALEYLQPEHVALKTLVSCVQELQPMDILTAIQISPLATKLSLSNAEIPAEEIMKFALIRNLRELEIANDPKVRFLDFSTSILPLLRMKGHQLESLTLSHFPDICVQAIGTCCPNLRKFSVTHVDAFACSSVANDNSPENEAMISSGVVAINGSSSDAAAENTADEGHNGDEISEPANGIESTPSHPMFGKLEDFEMICQFYGIVPRAEHLLTCLVKAEDLKRMTFKACTSADDRFFSKLLRVNPLKKLQKISLDFCPVTTKTVLKFLRMENDLHFMTVCDTGGIDLKSYRDITIEANSMNLDLYIEWSD